MSKNPKSPLLIFTVLITLVFFIPSCGSGEKTTSTSPTSTLIPLIEYQVPKPETLGTLNGKVMTSTNLSTGKAEIRGFGVTLDSGEDVDAFASPSLLLTMKVGDKVTLKPAENGEFKWEVVEVNPSFMPMPIMEKVDGSLLLDIKIDDLIVLEDSVWVIGEDINDNKVLSRIDIESKQVTNSLTIVEDAKSYYTTLVSGDGSLWAYVRNAIYKIDPETIAIVDKWEFEGYPDLLAVKNGVAWMEKSEPNETIEHFIRYDLNSRIELSNVTTLANGSLAEGKSYFWLTTMDKKELINAITGKKFEGDAYVVARIDPESGEILNTILYSVYSEGYYSAYTEGSIWLPMNNGYLAQVDEEGMELVSVFPIVNINVGNMNRNVKLAGIDFGAGALWVGHPASGSLLRIDPDSKNVTHVFSASGEVRNPNFIGDQVWMVVDKSTVAWVNTDGL